jgi:hypothetical protein
MEEQRYLKDSDQDTQPECTSVFTKTMGLPKLKAIQQSQIKANSKRPDFVQLLTTPKGAKVVTK